MCDLSFGLQLLCWCKTLSQTCNCMTLSMPNLIIILNKLIRSFDELWYVENLAQCSRWMEVSLDLYFHQKVLHFLVMLPYAMSTESLVKFFMRKFKIPPVYGIINKKPTLFIFFWLSPLYHPSCTYVSICDNLHEWNQSSLATSLKCMLNIKLGINMYLLGKNIFLQGFL